MPYPQLRAGPFPEQAIPIRSKKDLFSAAAGCTLIFMDLTTIYGNAVPPSVTKKAERRFRRFAHKFGFDPGRCPPLTAVKGGNGWEEFGIMTVCDAQKADGEPVGKGAGNGILLGTIRMGFGHCRMAIALASAAHSMGYTPYWLDLMSFPDNAASKTIKYLEDWYNRGSRISQRWAFFNKHVWEYITSDAGRQLTFSVQESSLSRIFAPVFRDIPRDMPFLSTHPWAGHAAVAAGMSNVISVVPDNYPLAFHIVEGSTHTVQSPSAYMGYRTFLSMGKHMALTSCMPEEAIRETGHYVDHEIVANIEEDCGHRLRRIRDGETRRFLLTMGGAGAQVRRFADIAAACKGAIEDGKAALLINMGDHKGRWADLEPQLRENGISWTLHTDWNETKAFVREATEHPVRGVHVFLHDSFYAAVYATNLLMRVSDVMITKPSELSFYPVPKLFIHRVGRHEAWGAIRGSEIGDGTIETASSTGLHRTLRLLIEDKDLPELYCSHILKNNRGGIYNGAYNVVKLAKEKRTVT